MTPLAAIAWALITVTGGGTIGHSEFRSKPLCEEARSIALYGETVEERAREAAAYEAWLGNLRANQSRLNAAWLKKHPCLRTPHDSAFGPSTILGEEVFSYARTPHGWYCPIETGSVGGIPGGPGYSPDRGEFPIFDAGGFSYRVGGAGDVKTAACVEAAP